jgi:hypothetical protein
MRPSFCAVISVSLLVLLSTASSAQSSGAAARIVQPLNESQLITLKGNTHPLARAEFDRGTAPTTLPMDRMLLVLKRSPEQQLELTRLLDQQQDKNSPQYHAWLTPQEFGRRFGPSDDDIRTITGWLQAHGFEVNKVANGRTVIEFSGNAGQVREAFHTPIHKYLVKGEEHWANAGDLQIPAALTPVVAGVNTLHNFYKKPLHGASKQVPMSSVVGPDATGTDGSHALVPGDFAVIYNINPVYSQGIRGDGATIAVVGRTNFDPQDVGDYWSLFSSRSNSLRITTNGPDPGIVSFGEQVEATLDVTWSGAIAPGASVNFVLSASTNATDGVDLSELYIVDNNAGDVMTESFGQCELAFSPSQATAISQLAEQAAAEGITYMVSTGDTGASGCDNLGENVGSGQVSANMLSATPFNVAVGGTLFNEHGQNSLYWNSTNSSDFHSAKSYIPENAWNETCTGGCPDFPPPLAAGGGGASMFFSKPIWQTGVSGIPSDGKRDQPDVSFTAAAHDGYLLCVAQSCRQGDLFIILGTSASAPSFAGVMALVDQKMGAGGPPQRQGQADYVLYKLAATENFSQCNGSKTTAAPAASCIFNDITSGNIAVPGQAGYGTSSAKYQATVGYDLASGLGSVNVANLVNKWSSIAFNSTITNLDLTPKTNIVHGQSVSVTASVTDSNGNPGPTGDITLMSGSASGTRLDTLSLTGSAVALPTNRLAGGSYDVVAHYSGDKSFAPSESAPVSVTVSAEPSTTVLTMLALDFNGSVIGTTNIPYGFPLIPQVTVSGQSGIGEPSGQVGFAGEAANITSFPQLNLNNQGKSAASIPVTTVPPGNHSLQAQYFGDGSFQSSNSTSSGFSVVTADNNAVLTISPASQIGSRTTVTLTAKINTNSAGNAPSGTVEFFDGSTSLGSGAAFVSSVGGFVSPNTFNLAQSTASLSVTLPSGQASLTARYAGDANYKATISNLVGVAVQPDFDISAAAPSMTISSPGGNGTLTFTVTGDTGYNGTINFTAASCTGLPRESTCSFSPAALSGSGQTTLTISTTAPKTAALRGTRIFFASALAFAAALIFSSTPQKKRWSAMAALAIAITVMPIASCGGGSSSGGGGGDPGTPIGSSNVTVTASATSSTGTLARSTSFTLMVQ